MHKILFFMTGIKGESSSRAAHPAGRDILHEEGWRLLVVEVVVEVATLLSLPPWYNPQDIVCPWQESRESLSSGRDILHEEGWRLLVVEVVVE